MASCGSQMQCRRRKGREERFLLRLRRYGAPILFALVMHTVFFGCAKIRIGFPPKVERLELLKAGISAPADVLLALGEPRGHGVLRFSPAVAPRDIWLYEYAESSGKRIDLKMLLVFFHEGRYDGHLWFSSGKLISSTLLLSPAIVP